MAMAVAGMNPYMNMGVGGSILMGMGMGMGIGMGMGMGQMGMPMMGMPMMGMGMGDMSGMMQMETLMLMNAEMQLQQQQMQQQMLMMAQLQQMGNGANGQMGGFGNFGNFGNFGQMGGYGGFQGGCGSNSAAVSYATSQLGKAAINVNLPNYRHAGGVTNDCADFVSACCANAGTFRKTPADASVVSFRNNLIAQGWRPVPKDQAKPGDVAIISGSAGPQHTELVATQGATKCIGSNGSSFQSISYDTPQSWASGVMYLAPPPNKA
jgi:Putative amidase domain